MQRDAYQAIWRDPRFRGLTSRAKLAFMMIVTGPHIEPCTTGLYWWQCQVLCRDLGFKKNDADAAARELVGAGLIHYDDVYRCLYVPMMLDIDRPRSPKNISGWARNMHMLPESLLRNQWIDQLREHCEERGGSFQEWYHRLGFDEHRVPEETQLDPVEPQVGLPDLRPVTKEDEEAELELFKVEATPKDEREQHKHPEGMYLVDKILVPHVEKLVQKKVTDQRRKSWAAELTRIRALDERPWDLIEEIMRWAVEDRFWRQQIQSAKAVRKHFDKLVAKKRHHEGIVASEAVEDFIKEGKHDG